MSKDIPIIKPLKSSDIEIGDGRFNLKNVLESTINLMEIAEDMQEIEGKERKEYVLYKMEKKLGKLYAFLSNHLQENLNKFGLLN